MSGEPHMVLEWIARLDRWLTDGLSTVLALALTLLIFAEIASKALLSTSILWSTDLVTFIVTFILLWMIFLGGALTCIDREEVSIQLLVDLLPPRARFLLAFLQKAVSVAVLAIVIFSMFLLLEVLNTSLVPTIPVAQSYFTLPCILALILYALYASAQLIQLVRRKGTG
jgi:TRAP-type C4-dicarboxylate transport system permease small subunit